MRMKRGMGMRMKRGVVDLRTKKRMIGMGMMEAVDPRTGRSMIGMMREVIGMSMGQWEPRQAKSTKYPMRSIICPMLHMKRINGMNAKLSSSLNKKMMKRQEKDIIYSLES
jgi:hypothetical protein